MQIKTKLTLLIGGGMMMLAVIILFAGTAFSIHEALIIKRHEMKVAAREIDRLMQERTGEDREKLKYDIVSGLQFTEKEANLDAAVFDHDGRLFQIFQSPESTVLNKNDYPEDNGAYNRHIHWIDWTHWEIDIYYKGSACWVQMNLMQELEIQEDLSSFFFVSLFLSIVLSLAGGRIITSGIVARMRRVTEAADQIASGNLKYRIPDSPHDDEIQRVERKLNDSFAELEESFNKIMEFSSDIAHELRTPLTIITGELDVALREKRSPEEYQRVMVNVLEEIALLRKIIDDMLILVKPESAYKSVSYVPVDISVMVKEVVASYKVIADSKKITISTDIEPDIITSGVKSLMQLIFTNLIYNAIKYTPESGKIEISLKSDGTSSLFSVSDNGPGIPEEEQKKIFSRFYRLRKDQTRGSGLGLAIVAKVCKINNAGITLESTAGSGSTFKVRFKIGAPEKSKK